MKHWVFHLPVLISVYEADEDAGGAVLLKDHSRRHLDVHVYADNVEDAATSVDEKLQILLGEEESPESGVGPTIPYIGPV